LELEDKNYMDQEKLEILRMLESLRCQVELVQIERRLQQLE
jgi:hypothetical protein